MRYLQAMDCQIIEKDTAHVIVKLSPNADRELTQRSYYWNFIERTGAVAETMTFQFVFDTEASRVQAEKEKIATTAADQKKTTIALTSTLPGSQQGNTVHATGVNSRNPAVPGSPAPAQDSILGRYFGYVPTAPPMGRIPRDEVTLGSRRFEQIVASVKNKGKSVRLFEETSAGRQNDFFSKGYSSWLCLNYKVELACDRKRNEMHSIGIRLTTGEIAEKFHDWMLTKKLGPKLPPNIYLLPTKITLERAATLLENHLEKKLKRYDHTWATEATVRLNEELQRIEQYYKDMILAADVEKKPEVELQFQGRKQEIEWQYRPKINLTVINSGLFHLNNSAFTVVDSGR